MRPLSSAALTAVALALAMLGNAPAQAAKPAAKAPAKPATAAGAKGGPGTTIVGEDESPIGLYITPWKNDYAERGVARPKYQLEELPNPVDPDTFHRQNEYYDTITAYRNAELARSAPSSTTQRSKPRP